MITTTYILLAITALLVVAAIVMAFRDRGWALGLLGAAILCGVVSAILTSMALGQGISPKAYRAVEKASAEDVEVDAAAQWALSDNTITPSEYGQIAEVYRDKTGKDLTELAQ